MLRRMCVGLIAAAAFAGALVVPADAVTTVPQAGPVPVAIDQAAVTDNVTVLMGAAAERTSPITVYAPDSRKNFWVENFKTAQDHLAWQVNVPQGAAYRISALLNSGAGQTFKVSVRGTGTATGFSQPGGGWNRVDAGTLTLPAGTSTIELTRTAPSGDAQVKSLELVRESDRPAREARVAAARANTADFASSGYGLMFQYGSWGFPANGGPAKPLDQQAADFNVPAFVKMVKDSGAGYVIWSYSWWGYHVDGPNAAIDDIMGNGSYTAQRDLIGEIADALHAEGLGFSLYYHLGTEDAAWWQKQNLPASFPTTGTGDRSTLLNNWKRAVSDIGARYGSKLDGFYFDDGLIYYPAPFEELEKVARTGNPNRVVSWNSWILPRYTDFQDVFFAEDGHGEPVAGSAPAGGNGVFTDGPQKGLLQHAMFRMEDDWGIHVQGQQIGAPGFTSKQAVDWALSASARKVPLSFNLMMYEDGQVSEKSLAILNDVRQALRGTAAPIAGAGPVVNQQDPGFSYSGTWQHSTGRGAGDFGDDVKATGGNGDSVTYTFTGTGADIIAPRSNAEGRFEVYVDGALVQRLVQGRPGYTPQQVIYAARHLTPGQHSIKLVKVDGAYLQVDAARVSS